MKKLSKIFALLVAVFSVFALAACVTTEPTTTPTSQEIAQAVSYVKELYKNQGAEVSADLNRVGSVGEVTITWAVDVDETKVKVERAENGLTTIVVVDNNPENDYSFTLTATFTFGENTKTESWTYTVKKAVPMTWAELVAAAEAAGIVSDYTKTMTACTQGVVTCIISKAKGANYNALYLETTDGGCFMIDSIADDSAIAGIEEGMTVSVKGTLAVSYSQYKFTDASLNVVGTEKTPVTPQNIDELVDAAQSSSASTLTALLGKLVTITNVTIKAQDESVQNGYYKFAKGSVESYVRISSSGCPMAKTAQAGFKTTHNEKVAWKATVTGIVLTYNGAFYLQPVDENAFVYTAEPDLTDEQKVAQSKDALSLTALVMEAGDIELTTTTSLGATVAWASDNASVVVAQDNSKATVTMPAATTTVKLTATITSGEVTDTKEFSVVLKVFDPDVKELTTEYMSLGAYEHEYKDVKIAGDTYSYIELGNYDAGIQMRTKKVDDVTYTSVIYNKTAFANDIRCVVLQYNTEKKMSATTVAALYVEFSSTADFTEATTNKVGIMFADGQFEYVAVPSVAGNYKYIRISYPASGYTYAEYWMSINIYTKDLEPETISLPETLELVLGTNGTLTPVFGPAAAAGASPALTWTVEDETVLTVANGVITPVTVGSSKVTVALVSDPTIKAECTVTIKELNYGTAETPLTVAEAYDVITTLASAKLNRLIYVSGIVKSHSFNSSYSGYTVDLVEGDKVVQVYSASLAQGVSGDIYNGDTVVAYGYTTVYSGTRELTKYKPEDTDVYPTIASVTTATVTITVKEGSTDYVSNLSATSAANGSSFTFDVAPISGKDIAVSVYGKSVKPSSENTYTVVLDGDAEIVVKVTNPPVSIEKYAFTSDAAVTWSASDEAKKASFAALFTGGASLKEATKFVSINSTSGKAYIGCNGGSGTTAWSNKNCLKLATTSAKGDVSLTFATGTNISKVVVKAAGWQGKNCTLTINGVTLPITSGTNATLADGSACTEYSFILDEATDVLTIEANLSVVITEIEIFTIPE